VPAPAAAPPPPTAVSSARTTNTQQLILAAHGAARLRDEQLRARVNYYNKDLATNAELDAITEQVVAELRAMGKAMEAQKATRPTQEVEIELIQALRTTLEKLFSPTAAAQGRSKFLARKIEEVQRRITQLFFNSELYARLAQSSREIPAATWPEQTLYFAIKRHEEAIVAEIDALPVSSPEVRTRAHEQLQGFLKALTNDFLSKTTPELERLLAIYKEVLGKFCYEIFPGELGEFAWEVVKESRVGVGTDMGYKITADRFHQFRETFDRKFLEHLVLAVQDPIAQRASQSEEGFREATLKFVADPHIHMEVCTVINDALYDYLHGEGYLDLPTDWKRLLRDQ
jgi:hypothetical protein